MLKVIKANLTFQFVAILIVDVYDLFTVAIKHGSRIFIINHSPPYLI